MAERFVRVRLTRIENLDLNLFTFDYDLTLVVFFMNAEEQVYGRYGGRDAKHADGRQSMNGLLHTMKSVLRMHERDQKAFAPCLEEMPRFSRSLAAPPFRGGCMHCHHVREALDAELQRAGKWTRDSVWRYPQPENLGFELEKDRGNVTQNVRASSPAGVAGLQAGDELQRLNGVPIHSLADAQFALDIAAAKGVIEVAWRRDGRLMTGKLALPEGWRKTDLSWRASMRHQLASPRVYGADLKPEDKVALDLSPKQLAFRQGYPVSSAAQAAGIQEGDIILGFDDRTLDMDLDGFRDYVRGNYLTGDRVKVNLLRKGNRLNLTMTLAR